MTAIINLNHFRKTRKKAEKNTRAARNRVRHGRRKDDRRPNAVAEERSTRDLDGRCLEMTVLTTTSRPGTVMD